MLLLMTLILALSRYIQTLVFVPPAIMGDRKKRAVTVESTAHVWNAYGLWTTAKR